MRKSNKVTKKILASIMSAAMIICTLAGVGISNTETVKAKDYGISNPRINADGSVIWDKVKFGSYKQSVEFGEPEPIKWRILSVDENNNALLLADKGLDCKPYNEEYESVTWETCTLRSWLNEDFYKEAFSEAEQAAIRQVTVKNDDNPSYGTEGGNDTSDKVYLLSIEEASNSAYGFDSTFDKISATRECKVTDYAYMNGAHRIISSYYAETGSWWLRSPGDFSYSAALVDSIGWGRDNGHNVSLGNSAIRPALQINLSSYLVTDAGEVASDGTVTDAGDGYNNPKVTDEGTVWDCVYFGRYKQVALLMEKEPIEWRVLSVDGDEALMLADKGLDCKPYNEQYEDVTWETCTLRSWLNEGFYNEAFTEAEKSAIKLVTIKNDENSSYGSEGGNNTTDKVYLLSIEEASNSAYGFDSRFNKISVARECKVTDYARMNGASRRNSSGYAGTGYWWLRSPGGDSGNAAGVNDVGRGDSTGSSVSIVGHAVRPALRINLSSSAWESSGWVCSDGSEATVEPKPTETPKPTTEPTKTPTSTATPDVAKTPEPTAEPTSTPEPTKTPEVTPTPSPSPSQAPVITATATATPAPANDSTQSADDKPQLKTIKLSSVVCKRNTSKISGKVSVSGATVKIKVGSKAYKKTTVKGKKFTLKVAKLKKKTKILIKVTKSGYKSLSKTYKVK